LSENVKTLRTDQYDRPLYVQRGAAREMLRKVSQYCVFLMVRRASYRDPVPGESIVQDSDFRGGVAPLGSFHCDFILHEIILLCGIC
jgi:hypothetical protein